MLRNSRKAATIATTVIFGSALLGGVALAAFSPVEYDATVAGLEGAPTPDRADKLKELLDALVSKNVITQAQENAILAGLQQHGGDRAHKEFLGHVLAGLLEQSAAYIGMSATDLRAALPGTSLGAIADKTAGKSRTGLIASLTRSANDAIDKAVSENKITKDQADKAKAALPERITKLVDLTHQKKEPRAMTPKVQAFIGDAMATARQYLGLSAEDLSAAVRSGKSLGEIASVTSGKSRDGLSAAITAGVNAKIEAARQGGKLTAEQATQLKAGVSGAVTQLVDRKGHAKGAKP